MNIAETLRGLLRRWYITFPGVILAAAVAFGAWVIVPPSYERSATQLLLPGNGNIPVDSNPLLYLGGLSFAADVLVRAVGAKSNLDEIEKEYPNVQVAVTRDDSSGGPFIIVKVDAPTDAVAGQVVSNFIDRTSAELASLQQSQHIPTKYRITVVPVAEDGTSTLQQRNRLVATVGGGVVVLALSLLLAGLVDGLGRRRRLATEEEYEGAPDSEGLKDQDVPVAKADPSSDARRGRIIRRQRRTAELEPAVQDPDLAHRSS